MAGRGGGHMKKVGSRHVVIREDSLSESVVRRRARCREIRSAGARLAAGMFPGSNGSALADMLYCPEAERPTPLRKVLEFLRAQVAANEVDVDTFTREFFARLSMDGAPLNNGVAMGLVITRRREPIEKDGLLAGMVEILATTGNESFAIGMLNKADTASPRVLISTMSCIAALGEKEYGETLATLLAFGGRAAATDGKQPMLYVGSETLGNFMIDVQNMMAHYPDAGLASVSGPTLVDLAAKAQG